MKRIILIFIAVLFLKGPAVPLVIGVFSNIQIGQTTLFFQDKSRDRLLITEIWYPTHDSPKSRDKIASAFKRLFTVRDAPPGSEKLPLIMMSHGTGGSRMSLEWLAQFLVKQGYIVAAVDHWGNTFDNKIPIEFVKPWERPLDMSFVLSELLKDKNFGSIISENNIGSVGFSFGGYTVIALAGALLDYQVLLDFYSTDEGKRELDLPELPSLSQLLSNPDSAYLESIANVPSLKDPRFKSFIAISPDTSRGFVRKSQFENVTQPIYIIGAAADSITPVESYARHYHRLIPHSEYYEFEGEVGHYVMLPEAIKEI